MIFRTESLSAGAVGATAATIVKAAAESILGACSRLLAKRRRGIDTLSLSGYELRDIGLEHGAPDVPIAYDLLDLAPRGNRFNHPRSR